jgi:hypothetical protein
LLIFVDDDLQPRSVSQRDEDSLRKALTDLEKENEEVGGDDDQGDMAADDDDKADE